MGALCEEAIALSAKALSEGDKTLAARVAPLEDRKSVGRERVC